MSLPSPLLRCTTLLLAGALAAAPLGALAQTGNQPAAGTQPAEGQTTQQPAQQPAPQAAQQPAAETRAPDSVVATVDGRPITERDLALATTDLGEQFAQVPAEARRAALLNALIEIRLLAAMAEKDGLAEAEGFKARMQFLRERALHNQYFQDKALAPITDEEVKARYDKEVAAIPPREEVKARHILVKTKEEAEAVIKQLEGGGDFQAIAKEKTLDPSGTQSGGDLGFFGQGQMVPEFEKAAFALKDGEYTKTPVETQFGFHVILREQGRTAPPPPFEQVAEQVRQLLLRERYAELVKNARGAATIDVPDAALKGQMDAMTAAGAQ